MWKFEALFCLFDLFDFLLPRRARKYASIGTQHPGPRTDWTPALNNRYPQWHCGSVQTVLGTCTGIATGDDFLQLGEWRLGAMDGGHFSVSHQDLGRSSPSQKHVATWRPLLCRRVPSVSS